ncbi:MAG: PASTA domain-containing protein, partial [Erysipelotrichaceae bacterium]|nr:PASTA domain-containing protein [Erysipelotrichaceae bacterium]
MKKFLSNKLNVVLSLILVALVATITIVTLNLLGINAKVEAIDFSNYTKEEVEQWIAENKLEEGKYTYTFEYDEVIEKDHVIYQSVKVGEPIEESLYIIYSKGENPDAEYAIMAIGEDTTKDELDKWFLTNGFSDVKYQYILSDKEVNTVLSINKASAKKYDEVIVTLSAKDDESLLCTVVPDLSLYSKEDLSLWAASNNIEIINNYEVNANMEEGTFIKQNPIAGSMVKPGSKLTITLSSKEEKADSDEINVPDSYLGYTEIKFVKAIEALGLKAQKSSSTMKNSKYQTGTVIAYDSTSDGKKFKKGDTVNYTLVDNGDKDQFVTVSDSFIGKTEAEFVKAMEALGLKAEKQKQTYKSNKYQTGVVYAYDSTSDGINFKKGDTVKYYLVDNGDANSEYVTVPDTYIGYTEENFVKAIEALGLKPVKQDKTYTSQKYKTGEVY